MWNVILFAMFCWLMESSGNRFWYTVEYIQKRLTALHVVINVHQAQNSAVHMEWRRLWSCIHVSALKPSRSTSRFPLDWKEHQRVKVDDLETSLTTENQNEAKIHRSPERVTSFSISEILLQIIYYWKCQREETCHASPGTVTRSPLGRWWWWPDESLTQRVPVSRRQAVYPCFCFFR